MITFDSVTKRFGSFTAVADASFSAPAGRVTGFLGPNGAGKSTSLNILCGLQAPNRGAATFGGRPIHALPNPGREVGIMLNASALHPGRTGLETLRVAATVNGVPLKRAGEMLERVGLSGAGGKRSGQYSLGMRQRLGLACALVGDPHTLVLDEPANGLDPEGIRWMRGLLDDFASAGGTVLLSSHILSEVQMIADRIVVIAHGKIAAEGDVSTLLAGDHSQVRVSATDPLLLGRALEAAHAEGLLGFRPDADGFLVDAEPEVLGRLALTHGVVLTRLEPVRQDLEHLFFNLTAGQ